MKKSKFKALYESIKTSLNEAKEDYPWVILADGKEIEGFTSKEDALKNIEFYKEDDELNGVKGTKYEVKELNTESTDELRDNLTESEESFKVKLDTFMNWYHGDDWETNVECLNDVLLNGSPAQDNKFSGTDILEELVFNKTREVFITASKAEDHGYIAKMVAGLNEFEFACDEDPMYSIGEELSEETLTEDDQESDFPKKFKVTKDIFLTHGWRTKDDQYGNYGEIKAGSILELQRIKQVGPQEYITLAGIYTIDGTDTTAVFRAHEPAFPEAREVLEESTITESIDLGTLSDKQIDSKLFKLMKKNNIEEEEL